MKIFRCAWVGILAALLTQGCDRAGVDRALSDARKENAYTSQTCDSRMPTSSKVTRVADPVKPSSCMAVLMMCNYCEYKADGTFRKSGMEPCGVCVGWDVE